MLKKMLSPLKKFIRDDTKNFFKINILIDEPAKPLGRWNHGCDMEAEMKGIWGNLDSCGDKLCGDPNTYKVINDQIQSSRETKKKKLEEEENYYIIGDTVVKF